mgnify:CR=1 FL=1
MDETLGRAKEEIILYAVQHSAVVHQYLGLLKDKAEAGCKIKILLMAARSPSGEVNPNVREIESHRRYVGVLSQLESSTQSLQTWLGSLSPSAREKVEIRTYRQFAVCTYLFIDRDELDGFVQVELLLYGTHVRDMPHYIVTRRDGGRFFGIHCEYFDRLWNISKVLPPISE